MKLTRKNTTILQVLGIVLVVVITSILMFKPEIVPGLTGESRSVSGLMSKKEEIESLNSELESTDGNLSNIKNELDSIESELFSTEIETERLRNGIENTSFDYHLPSIMVMLEQKAKELNLEFALDYDRIQTLTGGESGEDFIEDEEYVDEDEIGEQEGVDFNNEDEVEAEPENDDYDELEEPQGGEDEEIEDSEFDEENGNGSNLGKNGRPEVDMTELTKGLPNIPRINITSIPIEVIGSYGNIRLFVEFLDEIDLLEHNIADLFSFGNEVSAIIVFNVYHTDKDDGEESLEDESGTDDEFADDFEEDIYDEEYLNDGMDGGDDY